MAEDVQGRQEVKKRTGHKRLWQVLGALAVLAALLIVPPLVSLNHYQKRIAALVSSSLGRPVRMSGVSARLLPLPAFKLTDLTVEEDPAYGSEPVLHASTVTASIRLLALWRGKLELSRISVDEASVNLVRMPDGRWNVNWLFGRAAAQAGAGASARRQHLPYLRATNSRINIKMGAEKLPFSLTDTDLSLWETRADEWRLELKGQPSRTDLNLNQGDTGIVELKATAHNAASLKQMPVRLDLEWREAQLGQLARLMLGRDPGWRGDLRGNLHLEGTAEAADVKTRLRATGVHREEFAPASPLDFDANCGFRYHYAGHAIENLSCDSPLGSGRVRISGNLPGPGRGQLTAELDKIPVAAGLDALRTVRSGVAAGLEAAGTVSGRLEYVRQPEASQPEPEEIKKKAAAKSPAVETGPLTGALTVDGFKLSGGGLSQPLTADKIVLNAVAGHPAALAGEASFGLGGATPVAVNFRLTARRYQVEWHGPASVARAKELAQAGIFQSGGLLEALAGDPLSMELTAEGPWMPAEETGSAAQGDSLTGSVQLRNASWSSASLVNPVEIGQATLHLDEEGAHWDPVAFSYGPLKGTATVNLATHCTDCVPHLEVSFNELDAATLQAALLGAQKKGTLISEILAKLHPAAPTTWPRLAGTVKAESLKVGPVALHKATVAFAMNASGAEIDSLEGELFGGRVHLSGTVRPGDKPAYALNGTAEKLNPTAVGQLLGQHWSGGELKIAGKLAMAGYTGDDLAGSAKGALHLEWTRGSANSEPALKRFARWTADAAIGSGRVAIGQNEVETGKTRSSVEGSVNLSLPPKASFVQPKRSTQK